MKFFTLISWGTITKLRCPICSQKSFGFRNLASIVPATHELKFQFPPRYLIPSILPFICWAMNIPTCFIVDLIVYH